MIQSSARLLHLDIMTNISFLKSVITWNKTSILVTLRWRHNQRDDVSHHQRLDALLNRLFRRRSKKTSKLRVAGLCDGNSSVTGEFRSQKARNAENASIWWRHHGRESIYHQDFREKNLICVILGLSFLSNVFFYRASVTLLWTMLWHFQSDQI